MKSRWICWLFFALLLWNTGTVSAEEILASWAANEGVAFSDSFDENAYQHPDPAQYHIQFKTSDNLILSSWQEFCSPAFLEKSSAVAVPIQADLRNSNNQLLEFCPEIADEDGMSVSPTSMLMYRTSDADISYLPVADDDNEGFSTEWVLDFLDSIGWNQNGKVAYRMNLEQLFNVIVKEQIPEDGVFSMDAAESLAARNFIGFESNWDLFFDDPWHQLYGVYVEARVGDIPVFMHRYDSSEDEYVDPCAVFLTDQDGKVISGTMIMPFEILQRQEAPKVLGIRDCIEKGLPGYAALCSPRYQVSRIDVLAIEPCFAMRHSALLPCWRVTAHVFTEQGENTFVAPDYYEYFTVELIRGEVTS